MSLGINFFGPIYTSNVISDIPKDAVRGQLYISSHTSIPMTIYAYKLIGKKSILIEKKLQEYGHKFLPVYK